MLSLIFCGVVIVGWFSQYFVMDDYGRTPLISDKTYYGMVPIILVIMYGFTRIFKPSFEVVEAQFIAIAMWGIFNIPTILLLNEERTDRKEAAIFKNSNKILGGFLNTFTKEQLISVVMIVVFLSIYGEMVNSLKMVNK